MHCSYIFVSGILPYPLFIMCARCFALLSLHHSVCVCTLCEYTKYKSYRTGSISDPYFSMRCWGDDGGNNGDVGGGGGYSSGPLCAYTYVLASANYCLLLLLLLLLHTLLFTLVLFHSFICMNANTFTHSLASTFSSSVFITFSLSFFLSLILSFSFTYNRTRPLQNM